MSHPEPEHLSLKCRLYRQNGQPHTPCSGTCDRTHAGVTICMERCGCNVCHPENKPPDAVRGLMQSYAHAREYVSSPEFLATHPAGCRCAHHYQDWER